MFQAYISSLALVVSHTARIHGYSRSFARSFERFSYERPSAPQLSSYNASKSLQRVEAADDE